MSDSSAFSCLIISFSHLLLLFPAFLWSHSLDQPNKQHNRCGSMTSRCLLSTSPSQACTVSLPLPSVQTRLTSLVRAWITLLWSTNAVKKLNNYVRNCLRAITMLATAAKWASVPIWSSSSAATARESWMYGTGRPLNPSKNSKRMMAGRVLAPSGILSSRAGLPHAAGMGWSSCGTEQRAKGSMRTGIHDVCTPPPPSIV